ncbi:NUDIX domain-containing protein [Candidatus Saccharibacteria bacterium]|nr:NUDIX domain-containing protein [Candidatus Saccharibacteria bacterium]
MNKSRTIIRRVVAEIAPFDELERQQIASTEAWIDSVEPIYRHSNPARHLVSYVVPFDLTTRSVLLFYHRKSGLLLPPGGHLEDNETPLQATKREMAEELHQVASFYAWVGAAPLFLTATDTVGSAPHTDISLWFTVCQTPSDDPWYDKREFSGYRWVPLKSLMAPGDKLDPQMHRFARKLNSILELVDPK